LQFLGDGKLGRGKFVEKFEENLARELGEKNCKNFFGKNLKKIWEKF